ncbi:MAG: hypothetical protein DRP45_03625 [Candidatus Zixiibacteriota bacterium]|nr:MAG: hypothetical protein DRP45_03625 [candidate division Zixibacteria bacterium]
MMKTLAISALIISLILAPSISADKALKSSRFSMELEGVPLVSVLNMIASQNELNIVISGEVTGEVTMRLDDVDVATALDALLTANGYNFFFRDNVVVVKPIKADAAGELDSRVLRLKYAAPATVKMALESRKSSKGSVTILDKTEESNGSEKYSPNRLLITDYPNVLDGMVALVENIDVPERIILIEAKIIETTIDSKSNIGFSWPTSVTTSISDANGGSSETSEGTTGSAAVYDPLPNGRWTWGKLSAGEVSMVLNFLQQNGNSKLVSDPHITTLENHEATIEFQTIIPIQTINRFTEGSATSDIVTFEDREVGISLRVTPRINEGDKITLGVNSTVEDIIGYTGPPDSQKPITASRAASTHVTVEDGETIALGGLLKETDIVTVQKVPLLGSIPILGSILFTSKKVEKTTTDLLILITPHILQ